MTPPTPVWSWSNLSHSPPGPQPLSPVALLPQPTYWETQTGTYLCVSYEKDERPMREGELEWKLVNFHNKIGILLILTCITSFSTIPLEEFEVRKSEKEFY